MESLKRQTITLFGNMYYKYNNATMEKCKMVSVFTSGYVNMETILHFFYKITNERGTKTVFTCSCKMVLWPIRARVLFELFYKYYYNIASKFV